MFTTDPEQMKMNKQITWATIDDGVSMNTMNKLEIYTFSTKMKI